MKVILSGGLRKLTPSHQTAIARRERLRKLSSRGSWLVRCGYSEVETQRESSIDGLPSLADKSGLTGIRGARALVLHVLIKKPKHIGFPPGDIFVQVVMSIV